MPQNDENTLLLSASYDSKRNQSINGETNGHYDTFTQKNPPNGVIDINGGASQSTSTNFNIQQQNNISQFHSEVLELLKEQFDITKDYIPTKAQERSGWILACLSPLSLIPLIYFGITGLPDLTDDHHIYTKISGGVLGGAAMILLAFYTAYGTKAIVDRFVRAYNIYVRKKLSGYKNSLQKIALVNLAMIFFIGLDSATGSVRWNYRAYKDYGFSSTWCLILSWTIGLIPTMLSNTITIQDAYQEVYKLDWLRYASSKTRAWITPKCYQNPIRTENKKYIYQAIKHDQHALLFAFRNFKKTKY